MKLIKRNLSNFFREKIFDPLSTLNKQEKLKQIELRQQYLLEVEKNYVKHTLTKLQEEILLDTKSPLFLEKYLKRFSQEYFEEKILKDKLASLDPYESNATLFNTQKLSRYFDNHIASSLRCDSPKLILDFRFEYNCDNRLAYIDDLMYTVDQMYKLNSRDKEPFQMIFCNLNRNGKFKKWLTKYYNLNKYLVETTELNYTDIYPRKELVYLTADAKSEMIEYNPNKIYILGVVKDFCSTLPHSLKAAKLDGIKCERFPVDTFKVKWGKSAFKSLRLETCLNILLSIKNGYSWIETFKRYNVGVFDNKKLFLL